MTTDFRALCAELLNRLNGLYEEIIDAGVGCIPDEAQDLMNRAWEAMAQPEPVVADLHYAWELEDAEGEWQAGGSADSLEDVQREGSRYLQTYSQDGPHKLIIQRHCVTTIEEATYAQ